MRFELLEFFIGGSGYFKQGTIHLWLEGCRPNDLLSSPLKLSISTWHYMELVLLYIMTLSRLHSTTPRTWGSFSGTWGWGSCKFSTDYCCFLYSFHDLQFLLTHGKLRHCFHSHSNFLDFIGIVLFSYWIKKKILQLVSCAMAQKYNMKSQL